MQTINTNSVSPDKKGAGVLIRTITQGDKKRYPKNGDSCLVRFAWVIRNVIQILPSSQRRSFFFEQVHYECYLENGIKIDSTLDRNQALLFEVGAKHLITGLEVAVLRMSAGQLAEVTIPHLYGYGQRGHFPDIPPRSTLIFRLELVEIVAKQGRK